MTKALSAPTMLVLGTIACWTLGRAGVLAWDAHVDAGHSVPPPLLSPQGLPSAILPPPIATNAQRAGIGNQADWSMQRVAAGLTKPAGRPADDARLSPLPAPGSSPTDRFVTAQTALLAAMLLPRRQDQRHRDHALAVTRIGNRNWDATGVAADNLAAEAMSRARTAPVPSSRWAATAWALYRAGNDGSLGRQGRLGGSQAGLRMSYQLGPARTVEVFGRLTASPGGRGSAEAAVGMSLRPMPAIPAALFVERRERMAGVDARSAFAAYVAGGTTAPLPAGLSIETYGAAGVVGFNRRDLFAEGAVRTTGEIARAGPVRFSAGGGLWGAAQPGAARVDVGPSLISRLTDAPGLSPRLAVDYRLRVSGRPDPASGIAVTLSADF